MCGIVGLFLKNEALRPELGNLLSDMLITMTDRGPDSAGIAIYGAEADGLKMTVQSDRPETAFAGLEARLAAALGAAVAVKTLSTHAVITLPEGTEDAARALVEAEGLRVMGAGQAMEIYKEIGLPKDVAAQFDIRSMGGSHGDRERCDHARRASVLHRR